MITRSTPPPTAPDRPTHSSGGGLRALVGRMPRLPGEGRLEGRLGDRIARHALILGPVMALILVTLLFAATAGASFSTWANISNIGSQIAVLAVLATGLTFVLILGEIDLSVANVAVFAGVSSSVFVAGSAFTLPLLGEVSFDQGNQWMAIVVPLVLAGLLGLVAGLLIGRLHIPSFVATLGVYEVAQGWAFYWSQGTTIYDMPGITRSLGSGTFLGIPRIILTAAVVLILGHIVLTRTRFGRYIYMTGANRSAAELAGIPVRRITIQVFVLAAVLSGLAGMLNVARLGSAQANAGSDLLLPAIAAVVLGGTSLFGGIGGIHHTVVGLLLYGVLDNGLDQLDINIYLKPFCRGLFLIAAVVLNVYSMRAAQRSANRQVSDSVAVTPPTASGARA